MSAPVVSFGSKDQFPLDDERGNDRFFCHSSIDDFGLIPSEFRIYAHLVRRADNKANEAWPCIATMAKICFLHEDTVRSALKALEAYGMIRRNLRPGYSTSYSITRDTSWIKPETHPPENKGGVSNTTPPKIREGPPPKIREGYPPENKGGEGNPVQGNPSKVIQGVSPELLFSVESRNAPKSEPESFTKLFTQGYEEAFLKACGERYRFNGAKDGQAIKKLRSFGVSAEECIARAKMALGRAGYPFDNCATIAGFVSMWNHLARALTAPPRQPESRESAGVGAPINIRTL